MKEHRFITREDLHRLCTIRGWFNLGTYEDYEALLNFVGVKKELTVRRIDRLAYFIMAHTSIDRHKADVTWIAHEICKASQSTFSLE